MKAAKIKKLTVQQYVAISDNIYDEIERVEQAGMIMAKCIGHPKYGDIILISSTTHVSCMMIYFSSTLEEQ